MKAPKNMMDHIENMLDTLDYGEVTVQVSNNGKTMDVITSRRKRFIAQEMGGEGIPEPRLIKKNQDDQNNFHEG